MSTRCQIAVFREEDKPKDLEAFDALIYRHSDGYPSGVLPDVMPFLAWFDGSRGVSDTEYVAARLLQWLCNGHDKRSADMMKQFPFIAREFAPEWTGTLGHGICKSYHADIEYIYAITPRTVYVYAVTGWVEKGESVNQKTKLIGKMPIKGYALAKDYQKLIKRG